METLKTVNAQPPYRQHQDDVEEAHQVMLTFRETEARKGNKERKR